MTETEVMGMQSRCGAIALAVLAAATLASCGTQDRTVASVGGRVVTVADFEDVARNQPHLGLDPSPDAKRKLLDQILDRELLVAEAERLGYGQGAELAGVRRQAREEVLPEVLYQRVVSGRVAVSEAEIKALWDAQDHELHLRQIFSFDERGARSARARLAAGEPFAEVARILSRDRTTAPEGGDVGWLTVAELPQEVEQALRGLAPGRWAGPIRTPGGYYIVLLEGRRARQRDDYQAVRARLEAQLRQRKERALVMAYMNGVKTRYDLRLVDAGFGRLAEKWQNRTAEELLDSSGDPSALGFTAEDLGTPLATFRGGAYTIRDFFADLTDRTSLDRPPALDDPQLRLFVQDRAGFALLMREAQARGLDRDSGTVRRLRDREKSFLVSRLYEEVIVAGARLTPEERDRLRGRAGASQAPPEAQRAAAEEEARLFAQKRQQVLQELLTRLRKAHPPQVNEKALGDIPWPVPPKENA
jgi:peptidyl-prolyl cis-trans isomerase C